MRHGALHGKRVLVTRPVEQANELARRLRAAGAEPILAPTIEIGPPDDLRPAREAVARTHEYQWIVFTSRNGVEAFFALADERGAGALALVGPKLAAIGPKTRDGLLRRGLHVDLVPRAFIGEAIARELLLRTEPRDRILLFRAQEGREAIPALLRRHGRVVDVVAAYATHLVEDPALPAKACSADIITFSSSSAVEGFLKNVPSAPRVLETKTVAAIGPVTARTARDAGIRVDAVAEQFSAEGLISALETAASD